MEQATTERHISQEHQTSQQQRQDNDTVDNSSVNPLRDPSQGRSRSYRSSGNFDGKNGAQDKGRIDDVCRDFSRGKCFRGGLCKYQHSESDKRDGLRYSLCRDFVRGKCTWGASCNFPHSEFDNHHGYRSREKRDFDTTEDSGRSRFGEVKNKCDLHTGFYMRRTRSRSPCRKFLKGMCNRGEDCPHLHTGCSTIVKPMHDRSTQLQQGTAPTSNNSDFIEGITQCRPSPFFAHEVASEGNDLRTRSFSGVCRRKSPCRNFSRGRCVLGASCPRPHLEYPTYSYPTHDRHPQQLDRFVPAGKDDYYCDGRIDTDKNTFQQYSDTERHIDFRTSSFPREPRSRSPCRKFLAGRCYNGASCPRLHQVTYDGPRYDPTAQQHLGDRGNSVVDKLRVEVCLQFTKGRCDRGESCRYLHGFHNYVSSISDWNKQPHMGADTALRDHSKSSQYGPSRLSEDRRHAKSNGMQIDDHRHAQTNFVSANGCLDEGINRACADITVELNSLDQELRTEHGYNISGELVVRNGSLAEGNIDINICNQPFKRQRSRSRSPFPQKDEFCYMKRRRFDSHYNISRGRYYPVAPFHYTYRSTYEYNRPGYRMNNRLHPKVDAASSSPGSHEAYQDSNLMKDREKVLSHGMQQDQCGRGIHDSDMAHLTMKSEADFAERALQLSHGDHSGEELQTGSSETQLLKRENAVIIQVTESDSAHLCVKNNISATGIDPIELNSTELNGGDNAELQHNLNQEESEINDEVKQSLRTYSRKRRGERLSKCNEEPMIEEGILLSTQGLPSSLIAEICVSNLDTVSVPAASEDMKKSIIENNTVGNVLRIDPSVKQLQVKNVVATSKIRNKKSKDYTSLVGMSDFDFVQTSQSLPKEAMTNSRRKLLVLDLNGIVVDIVAGVPCGYKPDATISFKAVFKRPFCVDFLKFCFERFDVGVWSSRTKRNVNRVIDFLMQDAKEKLLFCWDQSHCTSTGFNTIENKDKPLVLKELKKLWEEPETGLPWEKGRYDETNTVLLDDSPYKALRNPPFTAIFPYPYTFKDRNDTSLGPGGALRVYLERLAAADNVPKFIEENPFGQKSISKTNLSWSFYSKIAGTETTQQEGNPNGAPCFPSLPCS